MHDAYTSRIYNTIFYLSLSLVHFSSTQRLGSVSFSLSGSAILEFKKMFSINIYFSVVHVVLAGWLAGCFMYLKIIHFFNSFSLSTSYEFERLLNVM